MADYTYQSLQKEISNRVFHPIYLLIGEEPFFIDRLSDQIEKIALNEEDRDFNQDVFYGNDADVNKIITSAKQFPMMAERRLIIVKEAQMLSDFEKLELYFKDPLQSTVLVINFKNKKIDRRKSFVKTLEQNGGIIFESKKVYENQLPAFIATHLGAQNIKIDAKSTQMLIDYVGNDLNKLTGELDKLEILLKDNDRIITENIIEKNVGISKEYNNFELLKAIVKRDAFHVNRIVDNFVSNLKDHPPMLTLSVLFNYFSNLLECSVLKSKSDETLMRTLNLKSKFQLMDYKIGLNNYRTSQILSIISAIRTCDASMKGFENLSPAGDLLKQLVVKILLS